MIEKLTQMGMVLAFSSLGACAYFDERELERRGIAESLVVARSQSDMRRCLDRYVREFPDEDGISRYTFSSPRWRDVILYVLADDRIGGTMVEELVLTPRGSAATQIRAYALCDRVDDMRRYLDLVGKCADGATRDEHR